MNLIFLFFKPPFRKPVSCLALLFSTLGKKRANLLCIAIGAFAVGQGIALVLPQGGLMQLNTSTQLKHPYFHKRHQQEDSLKCSLSNFGLNPKDWHLVKHKENSYLIENKWDPEFKFIGCAHPKNAFKNIALISL